MPVWTRLSLLVAAGTLALANGPSPTSAQTPHPLVGTWTFNAAKSKVTPAPQKRHIEITQKGAEFTLVADEVGSDGASIRWSYTTKGDGKPVPVTGHPLMDTATVTISPRGGKAIYSKAGKTVVEFVSEVTADGKSLVTKGTSTSADGKAVPSQQHYDRK